MVAKLRRVVGVSTGIMLIGFMVVMSVIIYRLVKSPGAAPQEAVANVLRAEPGARILSANGDGRNIYVTVGVEGGAARVHVLDAESLAPRGTLETAPQ
jgi:hypothetical protein